MRARIALLCLVALLGTACSGTIEVLSPRYFYGALTRSGPVGFCLADPRHDDPEQERCFAYGDNGLPEDTEPGDLLKVRYQPGEGEQEWVAVEVVPVRIS